MADQEYERILYEIIEGNIAKVTMNRPEKLNAMDLLMQEEVEESFLRADADPNIRVILLAGAGKHWSAGHDYGSNDRRMPKHKPGMPIERKGPEDGFLQEEIIFYKSALAMRNVTKPTIAMVQGACIASGWQDVCMCDLIIASEDAYFWNPMMRREACPTLEVLVEPYEMGFRKAKESIWLGLKVTAQEALKCGMVNRVVPRAQLEEETLSVARQIAEAPPIAIRLSKKVINHAWDLTGQRDAWDYDILAHNFAHWTNEARNMHKRDQPERARDTSGWIRKQEKAGA
ncbi:MAG: enoyl-CoA hydratase/isomerase family protein [Chloroflexi bacterium]|nr:enoyl-CoA hydratase/isomerase family protein [Chloroflexota bacterium]